MKVYSPVNQTSQQQRLWQFVGLKSNEGLTLLTQIGEGLDGDVAERITSWSSISKTELRHMTGIPGTTFNRSTKARFTAEQSERLVRLIRVMDRAVEMFEGDKSAALKWLNEPVRGLGWKKPADLLSSEAGAFEVLKLINRLEHGVFS